MKPIQMRRGAAPAEVSTFVVFLVSDESAYATGANRDHRQFPPDGNVFDIHRKARSNISFGVGAHYCMGAALARLEGRVALEEILARFPEWDVDLSATKMSTTSTVRGWESMPVVIS